MKKKKNKQFNPSDRDRNFCIISYLPLDVLVARLESYKKEINRYCFIKHDRDFFLDGKPKEPHIHLVISFFNKKSIRQCLDMFACEGINNLCEIAENMISSERYLLHLDDPDKAQYEVSEVTCYNLDFERCLEVNACNDAWEVDALSMLVEGKDKMEIARLFGRDFIIHYYNFRLLCRDIQEDMQEQQAKVRYARSRERQIQLEQEFKTAFMQEKFEI